MTSKETLKNILYVIEYYSHNNRVYDEVQYRCKGDIEKLEKDLERLEKLEKENQEYKNVILEVIDLLEIEDKGTKQKAIERLKGVLEK